MLGRRIGYHWALCLALLTAGLATAALAAFHSEPWQLMVAYSFGAAGVAMAFGAMPKLITDAVDRSETGIATGMNTVVRTVGSVIGAQAAVTLISNDHIAGTATPAESGFASSLWLGAAAALIGAVIAVGIAPRRHRTAEQPAPAAG